MDEVKGRLQVYGYHGVPLLLGHAHHEAVFCDSGIVNQNVYRAKVFFHLANHLLGLGKVGGV